LLCELLEEFWACWDWLEVLLRLEAFLPELRVALPLSLVFALLLELEDWLAEELLELSSVPNEECDADEDDEFEDAGFGGGATGVAIMELSATRNYPLCPNTSCTLV
jgi:hypothetical protein